VARQSSSGRTARHPRWGLPLILVIVAALATFQFVVRPRFVSPAPQLARTIDRAQLVGASPEDVKQFLTREGMEYDEFEDGTVGVVLHEPYITLANVFPFPVDIWITFSFDDQRRMTGYQIRERVIAL